MKAGFFRSPQEFRTTTTNGYRLLPFRFLRWSDERVFVSTDVGEWTFLSRDEFDSFVRGSLHQENPAFARLKSKHFLTDSESTLPVQLVATKFRTKYAFLDGFTSLHMFVVTLRCDHSCPYCQVSRVTEDKSRYDMSAATAERAVEWMFRSPSPLLKVEFQGGESLLNFDRVRSIVKMVEARNRTEQRDIEFVIATNLSNLSDEVLSFCAEHAILLSSSLDGPEALHNMNRPRPGNDSHARFVTNLAKARATLGHDRVGALMTTTEKSLTCPEEIVDEYVRLNFDSIFVRPLSPYGFAIRTKQAYRYQVDAFLEFYKRALNRVIEWNRRGVPIIETYAQLLLRKLLTPFATGYVDLQSPAGVGISAIVYNYDGDVYASDEGRMLAEMSDSSFRLGNLNFDDYASIMGGPYLQGLIQQSCSYVLPQCSECAFMPFCGSDPVYNWATQRDIAGHRPTSAFCRKHMALFKYFIERLEHADDFERELMVRWAA
jgi:His-Xaa-Ser system radical SAM maturase HxsB